MDDSVRRGWSEIAWRTLRATTLLISDAVGSAAVLAAIWLAATFAGGGIQFNYQVVFLSLFILQPLSLGVTGAYGTGGRRLNFDRVAKGIMLAVALTFVQAMALGLQEWSVRTLAAYAGYGALATLAIYGGRLLIDRLVHAGYRWGIGQRRVLLVGTRIQAKQVEELVGEQGHSHVRLVGRISPTSSADEGALGTPADLENAIYRTGARGVIVDASLTFEGLETLVHRCFELGLAVYVVPRHLHKLSARLDLRSSRAGAMLQVHPQGLKLPQLALKRLMDMVFSVVVLALTAPLWLLIAFAIKLDSPGPVLFRQTRAGMGGRPFQMLKFRTMVDGADEVKQDLRHLNESGDSRLFKIKDDPRVTSVGRILRQLSLDELPQLLNVLKGDMSLVGPRPFFMEDLETYELHHFERLWVLPGITGQWQVSGRSDIVDFEEVVRLDSLYIRRWSIWRDLAILLRTLPAAIRRGGAY